MLMCSDKTERYKCIKIIQSNYWYAVPVFDKPFFVQLGLARSYGTHAIYVDEFLA